MYSGLSRRDFLKVLGITTAGVSAVVPWIGPVAYGQTPGKRVIEVFAEAGETQVEWILGQPTRVYAFNGRLPGPLIEGNVGDKLIVHFTNNLPEPTTIHWHGVPVPAHMDGSSIAQHQVKAHGGTFTYEFELLAAGTFWYRAGVKASEQVEKGLYGALVVRDPEEDARLGLPQDERVLLLDDVLLDKRYQVHPPTAVDPLVTTEMQINGREGDLLLVNGLVLPTLTVQQGVPQRWRLINASNGRFMRVSLPGHTLYRIGGDGGLLETPLAIGPVEVVDNPDKPGVMSNPDPGTGLLLVPGERADMVFAPQAAGELLAEWHDFPRGRVTATYTLDCDIVTNIAEDDGKRAPMPLLRVQVEPGGPGAGEYVPPAQLRSIPRIEASRSNPLRAVAEHTKADGDDGSVMCYLVRNQGFPLPFEEVTDPYALEAAVGESRIWEVLNTMQGDFSFHTHGFFFQHLETVFDDPEGEGQKRRTEPAAILENKDTIRVPRRPGNEYSFTTVRLLVRFDDTGRVGGLVAGGRNPSEGHSGGWVFGSQILEQAAQGMLCYLRIKE